tara:strand:+ start:1484 stop:2113 length:630 start_codon:yes stop_codon:yes gene_type:complete
MAITYPISLPTSIGYASISIAASSAVAVSESPFTFTQQVVAHAGQRWEATIELPPTHNDKSEDWVAFLLSLKGPVGTFLLQDNLNTTPRGSASGDSIISVDGGSQTGSSLLVKSGPISADGYLLAGDWIQLGSAGTSRLYKVLEDVNTDALGGAEIEIFPDLRSSPQDGDTVIYNDCKGVFRLSEPTSTWTIDNRNTYKVSFKAVEVIE